MAPLARGLKGQTSSGSTPERVVTRCFCYVGAFGGRVGGDLGCRAGLVVTKVAAMLTPTGTGIPTTGLDACYLRGRTRRSVAAPATMIRRLIRGAGCGAVFNVVSGACRRQIRSTHREGYITVRAELESCNAVNPLAEVLGLKRP